MRMRSLFFEAHTRCATLSVNVQSAAFATPEITVDSRQRGLLQHTKDLSLNE